MNLSPLIVVVQIQNGNTGWMHEHYLRHVNKAGFLFQIPCADLHEVIDALVEKTAGTLQPFLLEEPYEENISEEMQHKHIFRMFMLTSYAFFCHEAELSLCHQRTFRPTMRTERGSSTPPPPARCPRPPPCLQNKVCLNRTNLMQSVCTTDRDNDPCFRSGADRWPGSPLSRSPAPDRRILTSPVPASPTNPMRRLILSPSPLAQSE